ncbi:MAG: MurR/RpiR family transcriptional regulator [Ruminococcaceae bacterium]|nr:MurR/RpiR family transcriptional regulator [Oscillospiraceae bacterium]
MQNNSLLAQLELVYPKLSKSHKRVADFILNNYEKAAYYTAARLGATVDVSESTVVRIATVFGYDGYPEFIEALQEDIKDRLSSLQRMEVASVTMMDEDVLTKVLTADKKAISTTLKNISREDFEGAAEALNKSKKIYILGVRSAAPLANFIKFYFDMVYDNVILVNTDSEAEMFEKLFKITENDLCLAISFPRYSKQVINVLKFVYEKGIKIIAITDSKLSSPLASYATYVLEAKSNMASFIDSLVAPLSVINALIVAGSLKRKDKVLTNFSELENVWRKHNVYELYEVNGDE